MAEIKISGLYSRLKKILKKIHSNLENTDIAKRLGDESLFKELEQSISYYLKNYEDFKKKLDEEDEVKDFIEEAERLLNLTNDATFNIHVFKNMAIRTKRFYNPLEDISEVVNPEIELFKDSFNKKEQHLNDLIEILKQDQLKYKNEYENTIKKNEELLSTIISEANREKENYSKNLEVERGKSLGIEKAHQKILEEQIKEIQDYDKIIKTSIEETTEKIINFEKSHKESINLKESNKYWKTKKRWHSFWGGLYFIFFIMIIIIPIYKLISMEQNILDSIHNYNLAKYGIYILGISLWLWIARLALKLSFSNRHLAEEAKEKGVMINTYLALTKEGQMDKSNEKIILEAIFRPSTNGLIKDDSAVTLLDLVKAIKK